MWGAIIGGGLAGLGGIMGGNRALAAAELGAKSDADKLKFGIMGQREQGYGAAAGGIAGRVGQDILATLGQGREKDAFEYMTGIGADKKRGANMADMRAFTGFKLSPEYAEAKRREIGRKKDMLRAQAMFSPQAMQYGPIAPFFKS
jgi:hypothetical protein